MKQGWVSLHRQIQENWVWDDKPFARGQAWIDMLLMANHCSNKVPIGNEIVLVEAGSFITSEVKLGERWGWSRTKVRTFLELLFSDGMIEKKTDRKKTTITIVNYMDFQHQRTDKEHQKNPNRTNERLSENINNNVNNSKNAIKNYTEEFETFWKVYPRKKEKAKAYKCFNARLKEGYTEKCLIDAAVEYAKECKQRKTEEIYIKLGATFLGVNKPFDDYIRKEKENECEENRRQAADLYREFTS